MKFAWIPAALFVALIVGIIGASFYTGQAVEVAAHSGATTGCAHVYNGDEAAHYLFGKWDYHAAGHTRLPKPLPEWDFYGEQTIDEWLTDNAINSSAWINAKWDFGVYEAHYDAGLDQYIHHDNYGTNLQDFDRGLYNARFGVYLFPMENVWLDMESNIRACVYYNGARPTPTPTPTPTATATLTPTPTSTPTAN